MNLASSGLWQGGERAARIERRLAFLFGPGAAVRVARPEMYESRLLESTIDVPAGMTRARRGEFLAGRICASEALASLGHPGHSVGRQANGGPNWPTGVVGSITHCEGFCCAVVASSATRAPMGVDAEPIQQLEAAVEHLFAGSEERALWTQLAAQPACGWGLVAFSVKEAVFKSLAPTSSRTIELAEIRLRLTPATRIGGRFHAGSRSGAAQGFWFIQDGRVHSGAVATRW